jgi:diacylglycerol O-acyltransferase
MERLSGLDASFLYMETPTLHMHTLKVAVVDRGDGGEDFSFENFRAVFAQCLPLLPPFRRRIVLTPLGLDHPVWIEDPDFDLDRHLTRVTLAPPGGARELAAVVSEIAERPLDRSRPLWELAVIDGLAGGRIGFVAKMHHAVADGIAAAELLMNVLSESVVDPRWAARFDPWTPEPLPSRRRMIADAIASQARRVRGLPHLLLSTTRGARTLANHMRTSGVSDAPVPFRTPVTPFNGALTPRRVFATAVLPLDELRALRKKLDATLNDVFLAVCAGALRRYLFERGALPDQPLVAGVPASSLPGERGRMSGNRVSSLFTALPTERACPIARLQAIKAASQEAKRRHAALGPTMLERWSEFALPLPYATTMRAWSRLRMADRVRPPINLVVSSVPGPRAPLHLRGARLVSLHSVGPILEGIGLNLTAWSYVDGLYVGVLACPEHVPDPWRIVDHMHTSLEELKLA